MLRKEKQCLSFLSKACSGEAERAIVLHACAFVQVLISMALNIASEDALVSSIVAERD